MKEDNTCPCRHCADRVIGCHGNCMKYMQWSAKRQKATENIRKQKESEREAGEYIHQAAKRMSRGRKR